MPPLTAAAAAARKSAEEVKKKTARSRQLRDGDGQPVKQAKVRRTHDGHWIATVGHERSAATQEGALNAQRASIRIADTK